MATADRDPSPRFLEMAQAAIDRVTQAIDKPTLPSEQIVGRPLDSRLRVLTTKLGDLAVHVANATEALEDGMPGAAAVYRRDIANALASLCVIALTWLASEMEEVRRG